VVVQVGASENICSSSSSSSAGAQGKRKHGMKLSLPPKLVGKLVFSTVPVISLCKIFIPSYAFDALLRRNWPFSPPNRLTLRITLLLDENLQSSIKQSTQPKGKKKVTRWKDPSLGILSVSVFHWPPIHSMGTNWGPMGTTSLLRMDILNLHLSAHR
jgi:hypothetical protein